MSPTIALCVTCGDRLVHLKRTLPQNLKDNRGYPNLKIVVLDYSSTDGLSDWILNDFQDEFASGRLVYYRYPGAPYFRMAHAKNMAHRLAIREGAEILVNMDADNFTGGGFANYVAEKFSAAEEEGEPIFLRPRENDTGPPGGDVANRMPQGAAGRIAVSASAFLQAGGYDEWYVFWGPDDKDFNARLLALGYIRHGINKCHLRAIWHENDLRFKIKQPGAPQGWGDAAYQFSMRGRENLTVANYGKFGMGGVFRNGERTPITLGPVPTRIFGIGMHKTATTSLAKALQTLGFNTAHWESPKWAKNIVQEMDRDQRSLTLEGYYCLTDMPIGYLFVELDRAYPGSKFILTIRDESEWLQSARAHWERYAEQWGKDPFSDQMHRHVYGRADFDAEVFIQRYRAHNSEVMQYFKYRPGDLLVMDMSKGAGWDELCAFVDRPIPDASYPLAFVTESAP